MQTYDSTHRSRLAQASVALLDAVDVLVAEFPEVPSSIVYEKVGEARSLAARYLPDLTRYRQAIEEGARLRLRCADPSRGEWELSAGTVM
jgi:hypothetical protein